MNLTSCSVLMSKTSPLNKSEAAKITQSVAGSDICTLGIEPFDFTGQAGIKLNPQTLHNMALINCTLWRKCKFNIPHPEYCPISF